MMGFQVSYKGFVSTNRLVFFLSIYSCCSVVLLECSMAENTSELKFSVCKAQKVTNDIIGVYGVTSLLRCVKDCSVHPTCRSVNVCVDGGGDGGSGGRTCGLSSSSHESCQSGALSGALSSSSDCRYLRMIDRCQNGGQLNKSTLTCDCPAGWQGSLCDTDADDCNPDPCQNGATCVDDGFNAYTCTCAAGYTGQNCQTDVDDCNPDPCQNGATCVDRVNAYTCTCAAGYTGQNCQTDVDDCNPDPCQNGAPCVDGVNTYTCTCAAGYTGQYCQTDADDCNPDPCQNGAPCVDGVNTYTCTCATGYTGENCQTGSGSSSSECQTGPVCEDALLKSNNGGTLSCCLSGNSMSSICMSSVCTCTCS